MKFLITISTETKHTKKGKKGWQKRNPSLLLEVTKSHSDKIYNQHNYQKLINYHLTLQLAKLR